MSTILGLAQLTQEEYDYAMRNDRTIIYSAIDTYNMMIAEARQIATSFFVQGNTTMGREKYQLPMSGRDEPIRSDGQPNVKRRYGSWNVGYPILTYKPQIGMTPVGEAYLTAQELQAHIDGINNGVDSTKRFEILKRIFDNTQTAFVDPEDTLTDETVEPLANGDAVVYPPVLGSETEATENHYLESNYASSAIDDDNNPYKTIVADLIHHFGRVTGGSNIVVLINDAEREVTEALTGFVPVEDNYIQEGNDSDILPQPGNIPGEVIGRVSGATVSVWDWIPANYMFGRHMSAPAPLKQRIDIYASLGMGNLVNMGLLDENAFNIDRWMYRFGMGTGNRLNGVVMELGTGGTYTIPTAYQ